MIFHRPNLLSDLRLLCGIDTKPISLFVQISNLLYNRGVPHATNDCPFVGEIAPLIDQLQSLPSQRMVQLETWILLLPLCVKHKQCVYCLQEANDGSSWGMRSLRTNIVDAASQLIQKVHEITASTDGFMPPLLAASRALISGCTVATAISKHWASPEHHIKDLMKCTEVLSVYAATWEGGDEYLKIWRKITDLLDYIA